MLLQQQTLLRTIDAQNTTGAGDVFHGVNALSIAETRPLREAIRCARAAAALKCRHARSWFGMPSEADLDRLLRA